MPRGDRTGPDGAGAMTGRGLGFCAGFAQPGYMAGGFGRRNRFGGRGGRGGQRRGWGRGITGIVPQPAIDDAAPSDTQTRLDALEAEIARLRQEIASPSEET